jgi:cytochrome c5
MSRTGSSLLFASVFFLGLTIVALGGQQAQPAAPAIYTAAQAQAGQSAYAQQCAGCHLADYTGSGDAPALAGADFRSKWGPRAATTVYITDDAPMSPGSGEQGTPPSRRCCSNQRRAHWFIDAADGDNPERGAHRPGTRTTAGLAVAVDARGVAAG